MAVTSTDSETPASIAAFGGAHRADFERDDISEDSSLQWPARSAGDWLRSKLDGFRAYWMPPMLLTEPPPSVRQLSAYAHKGTWTKDHGHLRNLGVAWHRLVSLPVTVICRYVEWTAQRPGRAIPILLLWWLVRGTTPGAWADTYLIHPVLTFLV